MRKRLYGACVGMVLSVTGMAYGIETIIHNQKSELVIELEKSRRTVSQLERELKNPQWIIDLPYRNEKIDVYLKKITPLPEEHKSAVKGALTEARAHVEMLGDNPEMISAKRYYEEREFFGAVFAGLGLAGMYYLGEYLGTHLLKRTRIRRDSKLQNANI